MSRPPSWSVREHPTCGSCRYAEFVGVPKLECRRRAPVSANTERWNEAVWPAVANDDICGEYQRDPKAEIRNRPSLWRRVVWRLP